MTAARAFAALFCAVCAGVCNAQFAVSEFHVRSGDAELRGFTATVDLAHPDMRVIVTAPLDPPREDDVEAFLMPTDLWADAVGAELAINANFFGWLDDGGADIKGLCISDGTLVSPPRVFNDKPDPAIIFADDNTATIGLLGSDDVIRAHNAVAGIGPSPTDTTRGVPLVDDRVNQGELARVDPATRHPATGVGVSKDGTTLYIATIDGRQPGWSDGATLKELGDILIEMGAWDAINLDGGGSTSFIYTDEDGERSENRPSGGAHRPVANHLGFATDAETGP